MSSVEEFYNNLSLNYHLQFSDWEESLKYQSMVIDNLIGRYLHQKPENIKLLDCSCGIGTQAIGLAL
ncbi:MAG TPA: class I SAM-dependent methyltransferase, partial [Sedimentibacter sp.]|nr:class I SAM-dependent methyltransferase [Sedimentibacter sp.]